MSAKVTTTVNTVVPGDPKAFERFKEALDLFAATYPANGPEPPLAEAYATACVCLSIKNVDQYDDGADMAMALLGAYAIARTDVLARLSTEVGQA